MPICLPRMEHASQSGHITYMRATSFRACGRVPLRSLAAGVRAAGVCTHSVCRAAQSRCCVVSTALGRVPQQRTNVRTPGAGLGVEYGWMEGSCRCVPDCRCAGRTKTRTSTRRHARAGAWRMRCTACNQHCCTGDDPQPHDAAVRRAPDAPRPGGARPSTASPRSVVYALSSRPRGPLAGTRRLPSPLPSTHTSTHTRL